MNLSKRVGAKGCILNLPDLPLLPGAEQLLSSGTRSSLHEQNREAVTIASHLLGETSELSARVEILFDPQTSGGLLGALPQRNAQNLINRLHQHGYGAAIIGSLDFINESVQLTNEKLQNNKTVETNVCPNSPHQSNIKIDQMYLLRQYY